MIVISILVILALIAMSQYNKTVQAAREATLREDLYTMRKMIDQYGADKGKIGRASCSRCSFCRCTDVLTIGMTASVRMVITVIVMTSSMSVHPPEGE